MHHLIVIYYLKCGLLAARIDWGYAGYRNCVKVSILKSVFEPFVPAGETLCRGANQIEG